MEGPRRLRRETGAHSPSSPMASAGHSSITSVQRTISRQPSQSMHSVSM